MPLSIRVLSLLCFGDIAEIAESPTSPNIGCARAPALSRAPCTLSRALLSLACRARLLAPARAGCALCCPGPFCAPCSDV